MTEQLAILIEDMTVCFLKKVIIPHHLNRCNMMSNSNGDKGANFNCNSNRNFFRVANSNQLFC